MTSKIVSIPISGLRFTQQNDVTASRALDTVYQNTTGRTMFVVANIDFTFNANGQVATFTFTTDGSNPPTHGIPGVYFNPNFTGRIITFTSCFVLAGHYYVLGTSHSSQLFGLNSWVEYS